MSSRTSFIPGVSKTRCFKNYSNQKTQMTSNNTPFIFLCNEELIFKDKPGYLTPYQSTAMRQSQILSSTYLGGTVQFGNNGIPFRLNDLGGIEGQPGGTPRPLRNKF